MRNDNLNDRNDELRDNNDDQLRPNTMNEMIREASGNADTNLNELQDTSTGAPASDDTNRGTDTTHGVNYSPNDASGVLSGGTVDMDNQGGTGGHGSLAARGKFGSNLEPKHNVTGSDFDGQVSTS